MYVYYSIEIKHIKYTTLFERTFIYRHNRHYNDYDDKKDMTQNHIKVMYLLL